MTDKLEDTSLRLKDEMDLYRKMMDKLRQNRHQFQKEKDDMQEVGGTILCSQTHARGLFALLVMLFPLFHSSLSLQSCWLIHLQNTALALYNIVHLTFVCV